MASFGELLKKFKEDEEPENLVPLLENSDLRDALVAWKAVSIKFNTPCDCPYVEVVRQWNWLWSQIEYDSSTFSVVSGVKPNDVNGILKRLMGLRLIYPDGTINVLAAQYLQGLIMAKLPRRKPAKAPEKPQK